MNHACALVMAAPRTLDARELAIPEIGEEDGLLHVEACGLCGTDHEQYCGALPAGFAFVPGHECVGIVETIGAKAAARWGVRRGDRVAVEVFQSCGTCTACLRDEYRHCARHGIGDMYGFIPVDKSPGLWGGYATHQYLAPDSRLLRVPPVLDPVVATLFNPVGAGIRWGATLPGTGPGDVVAVLGPGVRGLAACAAAREAGAAFVMVTGISPRDDDRLALAAEFGADLAIDAASADPADALRRATGRGADIVVDVTAKAPEALGQAVQIAGPGGTVVVAGTRGSVQAPAFSTDLLVFKELRLLGALGVESRSYAAALELLRSERYPFRALPRRCADFAHVEELLRSMAGETGDPPPVHGVLVPDGSSIRRLGAP